MDFAQRKPSKLAEMEQNQGNPPPNPLDPAVSLTGLADPSSINSRVHPQKYQLPEDSAVTKAEKFERHSDANGVEESTSKRRKLDLNKAVNPGNSTPNHRQKGVAPIKAESAP